MSHQKTAEGFDDQYTELKVANQSFFKSTVEHIAVSVQATQYESVSGFRPFIENTNDLNTVAQNLFEAEVSPIDTHEANYSGYDIQICLAIDFPAKESLQHINVDTETLGEFLEYPNGFGNQPQLDTTKNPIEMKLGGDKSQIRGEGEFDLVNIEGDNKFTLENILEKPQELDQQREESSSDYEQKRLQIKYQIFQGAVDEITDKLRASWLKNNNCTSTTTTIKRAQQNEETATIVTDQHPIGQLKFTVEPPTTWDKSNPVVRFTEEKGQGRIKNTELEECYISYENTKAK